MKRVDFPQNVLQRAEAAFESREDDGDAAAEAAYDAVLDKWALEFYRSQPWARTLHPKEGTP